MANDLVRFATGLESNLSQETKEKGKILFAVTGDNKGYIYFDKDNNTRIKMSEHALTAEKDAANNTIATTYLKSIAQNSSTINTYSIKSIAGANTTKDIITIPNASTTKAGLITGEAQTLGGNKTFNNSVTINDKLTVNEDIISLAGEPYIAQKEYTNILCTANNDPNGYLYYGQLKLKDYYTEWYLKMYISMDIPYDSTKTGTNAASYEGIVEYWGYANVITAYRIFNAHANTSYRTFWNHISYRPKLAGCQTYGHLLGFRFQSSWNPATTGYGRNIKIKIIHTDNCTFNFLDNMILYANAPGTGSTNFDGRTEYDGANNGLRETGDDNSRNQLIGAQYLKAGESCIDRYTIVMQEKNGDFSSICYKNATSNINDTATDHIKSTSHYVVGGPVYYAYSSAHTNAGALSSSQEFHTNYALDFRYSSNSGASLTNGKMVYLKFEKDSEGYLTIPDHPWYSQELPTEEDGYVYMSLGIAYSTYAVYMFPEHEYYEYIAGQIRKYVHNLPVKQGGTGKTSWTANQIVYASAATTLSQLPSGTDGQLLKSKGANAAPEWISPSSLLVGKATGDSAGDNIRSTYIKSLSVNGTTLTITKGDNSTSTLTLQDTNTDTKVTNTLNTTTKAYLTGTTSATTNTGTQIFDTGVYLDTTAGQLVATKFVGALQGNADTATKATGDSAGDNIRSTYIKGLSVNGLTLTVTKGDNSSSTLTLQDLDVKVNMKARGTTKAYLLGTTTSPTSFDQAVTSVAETGVYFDTTAGKLVAITFKGALEGNADTATALKNGHTFKITDDSSTNTGNTVAFNGTQDVTLKLPADVKFSNITATSNITVDTGNIDIVNIKETDKFINLYFDANKTSGASWRLGHIGSGSGDTNYFVIQSGTSTTGTTEWHNVIRLGMNSYDAHFGGNVNPLANNTQTLGTTSLKWKNVYATTFTGDLTGTAAKATGDGAGDNIRSTYIKSLSVSGTTLTITKGDSTTSTITLQDTNTDTKVTNTLGTTTKAYVTGTTSATTNTGTQIFDTGVYLDTTAGQLVATTFKGALDGNASTATKATGDSAGDNIRSTYIKGLSVSGTTLTITKGDNSTSTLTLQDTNTDTKVTNTLNTTTKAYITGTTSATTNTGTQIFDTGVYLDTTAGQLVATKFVGALQGNADTATKATGDSAGDNIRTTYVKGLSVNGLTLTITKGDNSTSTLTLQDLDVKVNMKARGTTKAYLLGTTTSPTSSDQAVTSVAETGVYFDTTAGKLVATTFKGALEGNASTATKATGDSAGDNIRTTYIKSLSVSGTTLTITKGDNSTSTITLQDTNTDTKVTNTLGTTTKAYVTGTTSATTNTGTQIFDTGVYLDTTAGQLVATTFKGALDGNALTATKATGDSAGDNIRTTYIKGLSVNGTTLTITKGDNSTSTITLQDTNTDTKVTNTLNTTAKAYITGTTSATTNTGTQVFDTGVYLDTTAGQLVATTFKGNLAWTYLTSVPTLVKSAYGTAATDKYTIQLYNQNGATISSTTTVTTNGVITIPAATTSQAGLITSTDQSIAGSKTFTGASTTIGRNIIRNTTDAPDQGDIILSVFGYKTGYPVYTDPLFESGTNSVSIYNNSGNGNVTITRDTYTNFGITSPGTNSNYVLRVQNTGTASPNLGGFVQSISSRANAQFVQIFRALVPVGYTLSLASNSMGTNYKEHWITSNAGTGKWEWYARRVLCGKEGTFSSGGHISISGTPAGTTSAPVSFYLSYCQLYDLTEAKYDGLRTRYADNADSATSATKATNDSANNQITTTYLKAVSITGNDTTDTNGTTAITAGSKGFYTVTTGANASTKYALPIAGESVAGIVVNTAQTWKGVKTFSTGVTVSATGGFEYSGIESGTSAGARPVWYSYLGKNGRPVIDASHFTYNPGTQTLTVANLNGLAAKATADAANNTITTTYLAKISENSSTINSYSIKSSVGGNLSGTKDTVTIPNASTTKAGLITGEAQTLGGNKTFNDEVIIKDILTAENDIISANGYPYIEKKTYTDIIATANSTSNGCFYLADIRPDNFYEAWSIRLLVHAYVPNHKEYDGLYDITISGYYSVSGSNYFWNTVYSNFNSVNTSYRPIYYSDIRTLNKTGYDAGSSILWGVDLYASTNPTNTDYKRTIDVTLLDVENCTFTFKDTPIVYANVPNTSHYYTHYSMDCANVGLRESADNDTYDRTYATNYVRVGSSPIHRYSLMMQDITDGFSSLVYKTRDTNNNDNAATGHVAATDVHFIPTGQVLYNSTGSWYNTPGSQTGYIGMYTAIPFDFRYASNCGAGLTIGKPVYYVFNKNADDNTLSIDSTIHTQTLPTTEDGKVYMFLGIAYATTHIYLHHIHPLYEFIDGKLRTYRETIPVKQGGTGKASWTANGLIYASGTSTLAQIGTGTDGQFLKSKGANAAPVWTNASDIAVNKAEKDGAGNVITTHYIKHGSISVSDTNHNMTYTNGANGDTKTVSLPFVKLSGDTMTGDLLVQKTSGDTKVGVKNNSGNVELLVSTNRGIYDRTSTSWIVYRAPSGAITYLLSGTGTKNWQFNDNGNLTTPAGATATANLIGTASRAVGDSAGNQITTTYAKAGSFATDTTNHKITYTDGANTAKEFSAPFVLRAGDSMTGNLTTTGNMTAVKFIGALQGNADSASTLSHKALNNTTLENTAGSFAFSGSGLPWDGTDWVGLQIGDSADKFQITANDGGLLFRQNDSGGTATSGWTSWTRLAYAPMNTQVGSSTKGIYVSNKGALTACDYELKATVNNATQYGVAYYSTTTNITSTAAGGANTALMGKGSAAPAFVSVSPTLTLTAGTTAGPKVKITVLGVAGTDLQLPSAGSGASGVVTTDTQTFAGGKTFNNPITANATNDSPDSLSTAASLVVKGGVSVAKNLSAKTIRIDNNQTTEGVQLQYDETLDTLNFVFV